jgi:hypothetical protein
VYPPFVVAETGAGVSLRAVPAADRLGFLAGFAAQLRDLPDGAAVEMRAESPPKTA